VRLAFDTNVLVYADGGASGRPRRAREIVERLPEAVVSALTLGELYRVLVYKAACRPVEALAAVRRWRALLPVLDLTAAAMDAALELAVAHRLGVWDAAQLAVAAEAGCAALVSEDMQDGFAWHGVTVANPFAREPHPLLQAALDRGA
jgi:predicted nucleic acid-binding protein